MQKINFIQPKELKQKEKSFLFKLRELKKLDQYKMTNSLAVKRWNSYRKNKIIADLKNLSRELKNYGSCHPEILNF